MNALALISKDIRCVLAVTVFSAVLATSAAAKPNPRIDPDYSALDAVIAAELKDKHTPGAVVAVISDNKVVYARAFGLANVETQAPMEKDMLFRIGSTTKMFTAAALVRLSEAAKIKLNEPMFEPENCTECCHGVTGEFSPALSRPGKVPPSPRAPTSWVLLD